MRKGEWERCVRAYGAAIPILPTKMYVPGASHIFDPGNNLLREYQLFLQLSKVRLRKVE